MGTALQQLANALADERQALLDRDAQRLLEAGQSKQTALQALASQPPEKDDARLPELAEANRFNGALLTRRRHEVEMLLRLLGQHQDAAGYNAQGRSRNVQPQRVLAVA